MNVVKIQPTLPLYSPNSSPWGTPHRGNSSKNDSKDKCSNQSFQDIFQQKLENHSTNSQKTQPGTYQVIFNRRPLY